MSGSAAPSMPNLIPATRRSRWRHNYPAIFNGFVTRSLNRHPLLDFSVFDSLPLDSSPQEFGLPREGLPQFMPGGVQADQVIYQRRPQQRGDFAVSYGGETSTTSIPTTLIPRNPRTVCRAWVELSPPQTGVPVPGAKAGVNAVNIEGDIGLVNRR